MELVVSVWKDSQANQGDSEMSEGTPTQTILNVEIANCRNRTSTGCGRLILQ